MQCEAVQEAITHWSEQVEGLQQLNQMAQIVITCHNEKVGRPLIDETCHSKGVNGSNKIMVFLPGLAQILQFCENIQRAIDLGWTEMLIPLPFHGQSSPEDVEAVFSDPAVLASREVSIRSESESV